MFFEKIEIHKFTVDDKGPMSNKINCEVQNNQKNQLEEIISNTEQDEEKVEKSANDVEQPENQVEQQPPPLQQQQDNENHEFMLINGNTTLSKEVISKTKIVAIMFFVKIEIHKFTVDDIKVAMSNKINYEVQNNQKNQLEEIISNTEQVEEQVEEYGNDEVPIYLKKLHYNCNLGKGHSKKQYGLILQLVYWHTKKLSNYKNLKMITIFQINFLNGCMEFLNYLDNQKKYARHVKVV